MVFKEFGTTGKPIILMFHGGGLSWWSLKPLLRNLESDYRIITAVIDGHGEDSSETFISIEDSAFRAMEYIDTTEGGKIFCICGLSIGAQIAVEILSLRADICEYAVIESALLYPIKFLKTLLIPMVSISYPLIKKKWYARLQSKSLFVPDDMFETYFEDSSKISKASLLNITLSNGTYSIKPGLKETKARVLIIAGGNEIPLMKKSAQRLHDLLPEQSRLKIIGGMKHGELSLMNPEIYCSLIRNLFSGKF